MAIGHNQRMSEPAATHSELCQAISSGIVRLYKQYYGRGPERCRTTYTGDTVLVLMRGGFNAVEQTLLDAGDGPAVHDQRRAFHSAMRERFSEVITEATDREVIGYISGAEQDPDLLCQLYVLGPEEHLLADAHADDSA